MIHKKVLTYVLMALLTITPAFALPKNAVQTPLPNIQTPIESLNELDASVEEAIHNSTKELKTPHVEDITVMVPNANDDVKNDVLNDSDNTLKFTIKKFLCAMGGVLVSSIVIFLCLTVMNKINFLKKPLVPDASENIKENNKPKEKKEKTQIQTDTTLHSDENQALKIFLEKTK